MADDDWGDDPGKTENREWQGEKGKIFRESRTPPPREPEGPDPGKPEVRKPPDKPPDNDAD